jgi:hypothetical protein
MNILSNLTKPSKIQPWICIALNPQMDSVPLLCATLESSDFDQRFLYDQDIIEYCKHHPQLLSESEIIVFDSDQILERLKELKDSQSLSEIIEKQAINLKTEFKSKLGIDLDGDQNQYMEYFEMENPDPLDLPIAAMNTRLLFLKLKKLIFS